jgi:hypothetical protein
MVHQIGTSKLPAGLIRLRVIWSGIKKKFPKARAIIRNYLSGLYLMKNRTRNPFRLVLNLLSIRCKSVLLKARQFLWQPFFHVRCKTMETDLILFVDNEFQSQIKTASCCPADRIEWGFTNTMLLPRLEKINKCG